MTHHCLNCGTEIDETHVTEQIDREGETIERHYCSAQCLAYDNGYDNRWSLPDDSGNANTDLTLGNVTVGILDPDLGRP